MRVVLEVEKGAEVGVSHELEARAYRVIGREGGADITVQLSTEGDRILEPEDLRRVEVHLARRQPTPSETDPRPRIGSFRRERDVLLDDEKVSRTHAMVFLDEEGPSIVDLVSTNGTLVNGKRVRDRDLASGDLINIGKTRFLVRILP
jgi:pSer/pThr/pTyr-binding forkhead associated (FHA) protein